jgi:hypothetical protein
VFVTQSGWKYSSDAITIDIPVSAVVNGKLTITFTQTWAVGDELYIQYIDAKI